MKIDLSGRIAVVTGGSGELGRAIVRTLAQCGANVAIHYHKNADRAESLKVEVEGFGIRAMTVQGDITEVDDVIRIQSQVLSELGPAEIIVNNAVIQYKWKSLLEQSLEDYETQYRSCVLQNVLMAKAFLPGLIKSGHGRIVAISTESAMQNMPSQSAYVAAKRGMDGVLRVLAKEIGQYQVTVNTVAPGWLISDRDRSSGTERNEAYEKSVPMRRRGSDTDVANLIAFLASDLAGYITGAFIPVCGGNVMPAI